MLIIITWITFIRLLESQKKNIYENKDFCNIVMSFDGAKILDFNQNCKSDKTSLIT